MQDKIVDIDSREQYLEDMQRYSLYTLINRYIPNVQDGLKPVQERVLTAMFFDLHCIGPSNRMKSAKVVGAVMGTYHPHGDCLSGDTKVYLRDTKEYKTIGDLFYSGVRRIKTYGINPFTLEVVETEAYQLRIGQFTNKIYHITLTNGYELKVTENHPLMLQNGAYIFACNVEVGDELLHEYVSNDTNKFVRDIITVSEINVEVVEQIPMFDFTCDDTNNIMLPIGMEGELIFICAHNSSIYEAMKPMINWFETPIPLIGKQGNFGTFQGDPMAADRYTEVYLNKFGLECVLGELTECRQVVDWKQTYDNKEWEPECMAVKIPLLLINGAFSIAVGVKVEVPHHSLNDVIDATLKLMHNPNARIELIPDPCMPCEIVNADWKKISNMGFGYYTVRGIVKTLHDKKTGIDSLSIQSIPDLVFSDTIRSKVETLIKENKLIQVTDIEDHSTNNQLDLRIILKRGADPEYVKQVLYKHTPLQDTKRINMEVLNGVDIKRVSYKAYLLYFLEFRRTIKFRLYNFRLQKAETRLHQIETYIAILESGDVENIIHMIRNQNSMEEGYLIDWLMKKLKITDVQAKFILHTEIQRLSKGHLKKYKEEQKALQANVQNCINMITHEELIDKEIEAELLDIRQRYGSPRKSIIIDESQANDIPAGQFKIVITDNNYIKKMQVDDPIKSYKGDNAKYVILADNTKDLLLFDENGKVFKLPVHKVMFTDKNSPGLDIRLLVKNLTSNIRAIMYSPMVEMLANKRSKYFIITVSAKGMIKRMDLDDIINATPSGIIYAKVNKDDLIKDIIIANHKSDVIVYSKSKALRMSIEMIPYLKRATIGNRAMNTNEDIDGIAVVTNETTDVVVVTAKGKCNRFSMTGLPVRERGKAPNKVIKLAKGDYISNIFSCTQSSVIRVVHAEGITEIPIKDIPVGSSISAGTKICKDSVIKCELVQL